MRKRFVCCRYLAVLRHRFRFPFRFIPPYQALAYIEIVAPAALGSGPYLPCLLFFPAEGFPFRRPIFEGRARGLLGLRAGVVRDYVLAQVYAAAAGVEDEVA